MDNFSSFALDYLYVSYQKNAQIPFCPKRTLLIPSLLHLFFPQLLFNPLYAKMKEVIMSLEQDTKMAEEYTVSCF